MAKIKYMGTADRRVIEKGDTFNGQYPDGVPHDLVWDWNNNHVIDTEKTGPKGDQVLPGELVELVIAHPGFRDVTDLKKVPLGGAQKMWRGMQDSPPGVQSVTPDGVAPGPSSSADVTGGTTVGGSTGGRAGATTAGGGTTTGGSTRG